VIGRAGLFAIAALLLVSGCGSGRRERGPGPISPATRNGDVNPTADERVRYYRERIAENPRLYPMYTQLGLACLDRARETHDPSWLARGREAERKALELQDNFESLVAVARIENYAHRFAVSLDWSGRAAAASVNGPYVPDPAVTALAVEAHLGLGQLDEARKLVRPEVDPSDARSAASLGQWLSASGRVDEAVWALGRASRLARGAGADDFAAWSEAAAAGVLLDSGQSGEARPHVEAAEALDPRATVVRAHRAKLNEREGRLAEALLVYESILGDDPDPAIEARAFVVASRLGREESAARHFAAAEQGLERPLGAGEVYTLGALARLYADAGRNLDRALALAKENLRWKRDREAFAALQAVEARLAARATP
jgi:tetratricopeptide (TPR) repeat protein